MFDVQTRDVIGESVVPCLASGFVGEGFGVEGGVEERVEGSPGSASMVSVFSTS